MTGFSADTLFTILIGAAAGGGLFLLVIAIRGLPPARPGSHARLEQQLRGIFGTRGAIAAVLGAGVLVATGWVVAGAGVAVLAYSWHGLSGAASERRALARLDGLAVWTESLRDTIAGAVGLEQAIPASLRVAAPSLIEPLTALVSRMHTRVPLPDELDMRRKVSADRRSTRRSVQIVVLVSVGMALALALLDHGFLAPYDGLLGQAVLIIVVAIYAAGILWLRRLAHFESPQRLLASWSPATAATGSGS